MKYTLNQFFYFLCLSFLLGGGCLHAQIKVGDNVDNLSPYAILELESTNKGFIVPRMSSAQRDAAFDQETPIGTMIFNTDENKLQYLHFDTNGSGKITGQKVWEGATDDVASVGESFPTAPNVGDLFYDEVNDILYVWNSIQMQWLPVNKNLFDSSVIEFPDGNGGTASVDLSQLIGLPSLNSSGTLIFTTQDGQQYDVDLTSLVNTGGTGVPQTLTVSGTLLSISEGNQVDLAGIVSGLSSGTQGPQGPSGPAGLPGAAGQNGAGIIVGAGAPAAAVTSPTLYINQTNGDRYYNVGGGPWTLLPSSDNQMLSSSALSSNNTMTLTISGGNTITLDFSSISINQNAISVQNLTVSNTLNVIGTSTLATTTINGALTTNSSVTNNGPVTNNATTTINGPLVDADGRPGDPGQILSSTGTSTRWIDNTTPLSGTVTNSTLRWNGSSWVEAPTLLSSSTGILARVPTTLNTTTLSGPLMDFNNTAGKAGQILSSTVTGTGWVDNYSPNSGTVTNSTLRWNGSQWVQADTLLSSTTGVSIAVTSTLATTTLTAGLADASGNLGTPGQILTSTGTSTQWSSDLTLTGSLTIANLTVSETFTVLGTSTLATTTIEGDATITGTTTTENLLVSNTLTVLGSSTLATTTIEGALTTNSKVTNNGPVTNNATTTLNGPLVDADGKPGDPGQILSSTGTTTRWIDNEPLASGTVTNSTLRWDGTDWVETTTLLQTDAATGSATIAANTTVTGTLAVTNSATLSNELTVLGSSTLATTTLNNALVDALGNTGNAGQVLSTTGTSTQWINISGGLNSGTVTNSTLRWNGSQWVQADTLLSSTTGVSIAVTSTLATTTLTAGLADASGNLGTPGQILTSTGTSTQWSSDLTLTGSLTIANLTVSETFTVLGTSTLATTTIEGDATITGTTTTENLLVSNTLTVLGSSTLATTTIEGALTTNSSVTNNGPVTNNATTTLNGPLVDADGNPGDPGQILSSTGTTTRWIDNERLASGTVTNSTLRWDGTDWVETTTLLQTDATTGSATIAANTTVTGTLAVTNSATLSNELTVLGSSTLATTTLNNALVDANGNVGTAGQVLSSTGTSTNWISLNTTASATRVTNNYTVDLTVESILVAPTSALTINLPTPAATDNGKTITIKRINAYAGTGDTLQLSSAVNIEGSTDPVRLNVSYQGYTLQAFMGEWHIIQRF